MDRNQSVQTSKAIKQFAVANYVRHLIVAKIKKITLFTTFPYTGAANISDPKEILMVKEIPSLMDLFGKHGQN
ncbi:MAG: hypothetical protein KKB81_06525 [Candidatus Margulisbacteria bacterium]|nr:hypothetical protein [Candidatus Margulisiibacteriota bacterium]MBU1022451.1 hypothetical protein [Candidatus Margulisiibacteriota bacterium]MBU1728435.1 hypothetical protein [Candidatus Margulisiibacteriota bacterium]MBU1954582.1 hypothetical protein [Candidatus Margulisiibacteriota bacterium]